MTHMLLYYWFIALGMLYSHDILLSYYTMQVSITAIENFLVGLNLVNAKWFYYLASVYKTNLGILSHSLALSHIMRVCVWIGIGGENVIDCDRRIYVTYLPLRGEKIKDFFHLQNTYN